MIHRGDEGRAHRGTASLDRYVDGDMSTAGSAARNNVGTHAQKSGSELRIEGEGMGSVANQGGGETEKAGRVAFREFRGDGKFGRSARNLRSNLEAVSGGIRNWEEEGLSDSQ